MRAIDADAMLAELKPITFEMEHSAVTIADMSNIMRSWVERQPTLTLQNEWVSVKDINVPTKAPNEPLTCDGCYWQTHGSFGNCVDCVRGKDKDNYRCAPERREDIK